MRSLIAFAVLAAGAMWAFADQDETPSVEKSAPQAAEQNIAGQWRAEALALSASQNEKEVFNEKGENSISAAISEKTITLRVGNRKFAEMSYTLDPRQTPPTIDAKYNGKELLGIYEFNGSGLFLRMNDAAKGRPKSIDDKTAGVAMDLSRLATDAALLLNADGSERRYFDPFPDFTAAGSSRWSRGGGKITYDAWRFWCGEDYSYAHVITVNADGTSAQDLGEGALPNFSRDDKLITFCQYRNNQGVWVMNADGSDRKLIDSSGWCSDWTADSDEIVYSSSDDEGGANLRVTNIKNGKTRLLLTHSKYRQIFWGLSTSPDGKWICYKGSLPNGEELAIVNTEEKDKGFKVLLSNSTPGVEEFDHYVNWTPDGKHVTALIRMKDSPTYQMYLLDVEGKAAPRRLEGQNPSVNQGTTSYSPDGKTMVTIRRWRNLKDAEKPAEKE
jgi:TolB protein